MINLERLKSILETRYQPNRYLKERFAAITSLVFNTLSDENAQRYRLAFQSLVHPLMVKNGTLIENNKEVYRRLITDFFDLQIADSHIAELPEIQVLPPEEAAEILRKASAERALRTAEFLITLAITLDSRHSHAAYIRKAALALGMSNDQFCRFFRQVNDAEKRKQRLRNSSRGIIAALVVIVLFVLAAKYLQSLIFGLLLACILLPLEGFFEKRLRLKKGPVYWLTGIFSAAFYPLKKISVLLKRNGDDSRKKYTGKKANKDESYIRQAVLLTFITVAVIFSTAVWGVGKLTGHYMREVQHSVHQWERARLSSNNGDGTTRSVYVMEQIQSYFGDYPILHKGLKYLSSTVKNPEFQEEMLRKLLQHTGGITGTVGHIIGEVVSFFCDLLLTIFFALLFLLKFASFRNRNADHISGSEYLVRNIFNGIWLPDADEKMIADSCRIINGILFRLRRWLKGYLTLILVDSTVYTICFFFLGVPFFLPLGIIAGCGIALPYLGPVLSCTLTLLVSIIAGTATPEMLLAIIICYLIYNGIVEQFILYPAVIGDSLGLNTLETIVVVLLGAIIAGIPGMIFSLPAASVAKYIIPMIYRGFSYRKSG